VKRIERQRHSPGGILIPDTAGEKSTEGRVVAVGQGKMLENGKIRPLDLKPGDRVVEKFGQPDAVDVAPT
jgi:chaperonin GroES